MFELWLIGIGTGNPAHLTGEGADAIRGADLILIPRKGDTKADLADLRRQIVAHVMGASPARIAEFDLPQRRADGTYLDAVTDWHDAIATVWARTLAAADPAPGKVALLVWGDPSLYDSTLRIADRLSPKPKLRVTAGITAIQALTAAHAIPLNTLAAPVVITTGRRLRDTGWPDGTDTVVVMLDGEQSFRDFADQGLYIWWGAYLGMAEESLAAGALTTEMAARICQQRSAARARHGWLMDTYILRRQSARGIAE